MVGVATSAALHIALLLWFLSWGGTSAKRVPPQALIVTFVELPHFSIEPATKPSQSLEPSHRARRNSANALSKAPAAVRRPRTNPSAIERTVVTEREETSLSDWRQSVQSAVRSQQNQNEVDAAKRAVRDQSSVADERVMGKSHAITDPVAQAFESALGKGWESGTVSSEIRPDGSRVERIRSSHGTYCVRIPNQAAGIDPFVKQERPLIAVKC
ncbi:hypothetical protein PAN31117_02192 [Pandoraea anapnoica]|uniref:Uncharacterized protein n=1 Tax=Pandoraea anapnoica TaxID=2508301 RepID=A0A5E5A205_9BURK|nr:hypothetical protein PAN31117_02192 [Pandoraea anapnoica]